jgi:hypothetical protein
VSENRGRDLSAKENSTLPILLIREGYTPAKIRYCLKVFWEAVRQCQCAGYLVVEGWNDDPRPLKDIPEARELLREAIRQGVLGVLQPNVSAILPFVDPDACPLGSGECWCVAHQACDVQGRLAISAEMFERFKADVYSSAATMAALVTPSPLPERARDLDRHGRIRKPKRKRS